MIARLISSRRETPIQELSDKELLALLKDSDERALDELIRRKTGVLIQVANRVVGDLEEARDVVQVAFLRLWEHRQNYSERWAPNTWIYRITTNLAIDHLRSQRSRDRLKEPFRLHLQHREEAGARRLLSDLGQKEVDGIFQELAGDLTEKQRAIFVLREIEGLSSREVSEIIGCKESTVRNHLFNARKVLRSKLLERYPEYAPAGERPDGRDTRSAGEETGEGRGTSWPPSPLRSRDERFSGRAAVVAKGRHDGLS